MMFRKKINFLVTASVLAMVAHPALAQGVPPLSAPSPGTVLSPPPPSPELQRREVPELREDLGLPDGSEKVLNFRVSSVRVVGATVIDEKVLSAQFDPLLNRQITAADLRSALDRTNALYTEAGYALGRAFVPVQVLQGGVLIVRVVEGYIGEIQIDAADPAVRKMVEGFSRRIVAEQPLRTASLERYLLLISDIPGVTLGGQLQSMDVYSGAATLALKVESKKFTVSSAVDNRANLDDAPFQAYLTGALNNIFGFGDEVSITGLATPELESQQYFRGAFSTFIGTDGLRASVGAAYAKSEAADMPPGIELISTSTQVDFLMSYPIIRATAQTLTAFFGAYITDAENELNGFTFSKDAIRAAHIGGSYVAKLDERTSLSSHMRVTQGFSIWDAGPENTLHSRLGATANFTKLQSGASLAYAATERLLLSFRVEGQYSPDSLFSSEEISFGGARFARGYNNSEISGDSGLGASVQASYRFDVDLFGGWSVTPYTFLDHSQVWNTDVDRQGDARLLSTGIGVTLSNRRWLSVGLELDKPINRTPISQDNKDPRLFVSFEVRF
ncbi:Polypeptide-transport-associated domain protein ShlB-type [Parvibaculum lavamentivorans DS-1]|uniref:Polypeptide-transport-associated domain protein ShlB-type n=2 Tax=Parvibaculum lavamentivorans TaxID=256618 RepID=A7HP58_PARL1|nr:Polypeptide-transport-associated domain protein ShlB-type [Parvibaculum lavamentivorans DS-1]